MHLVFDIFKETITITVFVMIMMMIIEYVNVKSSGTWTTFLKNSNWFQIILSAFLGVIPGCLGGFIVVSLYTHQLIRFGALLAALIATFGDEAYILFSISPISAIQLGIIIFSVSIVIGFITNFIVKDKYQVKKSEPNFIIHQEEINYSTHENKLKNLKLRKANLPRIILILALVLYIIFLLLGKIGEMHGHEGINEKNILYGKWINYTFLFIAFTALILIIFVSNHLLKEHIWGHVLKHHFLKIFLWTFGAMLVIHLLLNYVQIENWITDNQYWVLLVAILIGLIPVSGPHLIFISLFINSAIPFSILLANSIVQDGHASLPLFAESKKSFIIVKGIKVIIATAIGIFALSLKW